MAKDKAGRSSRTQTRKGFQSPLLRTVFSHELISFYIGNQYYNDQIKPLDDKDPRKVSIAWCIIAAKAAIFGHAEKYHKFAISWLAEQFIERKQLIIDALYECQKAYYKELYTEEGKPKQAGHWFIAVLRYSDKINASRSRKVDDAYREYYKSGKLFEKAEVASWYEVHTNRIHEYMMDYVEKNEIPFKERISPEVDAHRGDHSAAENKVIELVKDYQNYKKSLVRESVKPSTGNSG